MPFLVHIKAAIPYDFDKDELQRLISLEREAAAKFQTDKKLLHLWRVTADKASIGIWDVDSTDELHAIISSFPLFAFLEVTVTPLSAHPSAI